MHQGAGIGLATVLTTSDEVIELAVECPLLAQSGHPDTVNQCLLLGVKRTSPGLSEMSAYDP